MKSILTDYTRAYTKHYGLTIIISQKANKRNCIFGQYQYYIFVQPNDTASTDTHEIQHIGLKSTNSSYAPEIYDAIVQRTTYHVLFLRKPARGFRDCICVHPCVLSYIITTMSIARGQGGEGAAQAARPLPLLTPLPLWLCLCLRGEVNTKLFIFGLCAYSFYLRVVIAPAPPCALNGLS